MRKAGQLPGPPSGPAFCVPWASRCRWLGRDDVDGPAAAGPAELHGPADQCEQRVVAAAADAVARVEVRTALADEDLARVHELPAVTLDAKALGLRVAAVAAG
jgi:hypothetical protein